ncbi:ATP-binding protein [Actinoplanes sp. NPDC051343]|uniref:ATP-binding protein n=1 Tax=Actinoplanes sp. NPDC051343 TaxID=3363906 RepID=UPI003787613E
MKDDIFGRDAELATIRRALEDTAAGAGGCHVLTGPAGIGKSRLLRRAGDIADELGIAVAHREAFKHDLAAPLVTLAGALRNCSPPTGEFRWLGRPDRHADSYLVLEQLRASLETFAARRPLLVVIDDAHWMDELSALAFRELVPALESFPVRWIFAARDGRRDSTGRDSTGRDTLDWLTRRVTEPMRLDVLGDPAVAALCAERVGSEVDNTVLALASGCGGNPLRVEQLVTALRRTGQLVVSNNTATVIGGDLPSSFVNTVRDILESLTPDTRLLLQAGSVPLRPFGIEAAARLMRRDPADLFPLIDEASAAGLLVEDIDGLSFKHDLVRQAIYNGLRRAVREQLHRDAAAIARAEHRPAREVAEHLLHSGRAGSAEAVRSLRDAAAEVAEVAPATAADLILHALGAIGEHDPQRPTLAAEAVGLLAAAARIAEARRLGEEALRSGLDPEHEAALLLGLAEACKHAGHNQASVEYADRGLGLDGISDGLRAGLHAIRAHALVYVDDLAGADASGTEADRLGRAAGESGAAVFGGTARTLVAQAEGRLTDAYAHARAATDLADSGGAAGRTRHPRIWLGSALTSLDRFDEAGITLRRGREESERFGANWAQPLWHYYNAALLTARGRLDEAAAEADAGVSTAEALTANQLAVPLLGSLIRLAVLRADLETAQSCLVRMRRYTDDGITAAPEDVLWPEALLIAATGAPDEAVALVAGLYDAMPARPALLAADPAAAGPLVALALSAGDRGRAGSAARAARELAGRNPGSRSAAAAADHAEGLLKEDPGRLRAAVEQFRGTPRPLALATALEDAAGAGIDAATARAWTEEALTLAVGCGARQAQERLEKRRGPVRRVKAPPAFLPQLSPAERNVALLVAEGLTNVEVAERLFLSRHTVDSHLRKIFSKLGIGRRVELAKVVAQERAGNGSTT